MPLTIVRQDITKIKCDAIVNPTNCTLVPGGGVDAAIHKGAGPRLLRALRKLGGCEVGQAVITSAFDLPCRYIIHTVGPIWKGGNTGERALLESCYLKSLSLAQKKGCQSVAFPLISSGTNGFPKDRVLRIASEVIGEFLSENEMTVYLVVFDKTSYELSESLNRGVTEFIDDRYEEAFWTSHIFCNSRSLPDVDNEATVEREKKTKSESKGVFRAFPKADTAEKSFREERVDPACEMGFALPQSKQTLDDMLRAMDKGFAETLFDYIDAKGMSDVECYKRANIDRKTFSKIKCSKNYKPSKATVLSFAIALRLTIEETNHLLNTVGMSLSKSSKFDVIIEYFILNGKYDIFEINETLFAFDQTLLGV